MQLGKANTVKGTPDTFFRRSNGEVVYVECTTQERSLFSKLKGDFDKCILRRKSNQVDEIILFFTRKLSPEEENELFTKAINVQVKLRLLGIDILAIDIETKFRFLGKKFLNISLDTGQILKVDTFIEEYNSGGGNISTPLDNAFMHRQVELSNIESLLAEYDIAVIKGAPGIGKTKLAIEVARKFVLSNPEYSAYSIVDKNTNIHDDLDFYLDHGKNYIIIVDDANRQSDVFRQLLSSLKSRSSGTIKIILTVRNYAADEIKNEIVDFKSNEVTIIPFIDDEIRQIISNHPFDIKNSEYQDKIIEISSGNARIAIMSALLAQKEQVAFLYSLNNKIFEMFNDYFRTFIKDKGIFSENDKLRVLGVLAFFFTLSLEDNALVQEVLELLKIDKLKFDEIVESLKKMELVEVEYNCIRVSEQIMATYFFYRVFIVDNLLSFKDLLFGFYPSYAKRFHDTIYPCYESFGFKKIKDSIEEPLRIYLKQFNNEQERVFSFLEFFGAFIEVEALSYLLNYTKLQPESSIKLCDIELTEDQKNSGIELPFFIALKPFLRYFSKSYNTALEIAFEYCKKRPDHLSIFVRMIKDILLFKREDFGTRFQRQEILLNLIITRKNIGEEIYSKIFYSIAGAVLSHNFNQIEGRRGNTFVYGTISIQPVSEILRLRNLLWENIIADRKNNYELFFNILANYRNGCKNSVKEILEYDLKIIVPFLQKHLEGVDIESLRKTDTFIDWVESQEIDNESCNTLRKLYDGSDYYRFKLLSRDPYSRRKLREKMEVEEYEKLITDEIRSNFSIKTKEDIFSFKRIASIADKLPQLNTYWYFQSIDIVVVETFRDNPELGFVLLTEIINDSIKIGRPLPRILKEVLSRSDKSIDRLWSIIKDLTGKEGFDWQFDFFDNLEPEYFKLKYKIEFLETLSKVNNDYKLNLFNFENYLVSQTSDNKSQINRDDYFNEFLFILKEKLEKQKIFIELPFRFFEKVLNVTRLHDELLFDLYVKQKIALKEHFDYGQIALKMFVRNDPSCLIQYIKTFYSDQSVSLKHYFTDDLSFVWGIDMEEKYIEESINLIISNTQFHSIGDHPIIIFFRNIKDSDKDKVIQFFIRLIIDNSKNSKLINPIFDIVMHNFDYIFEVLFLVYINTSPTVELFHEINWSKEGGLNWGSNNRPERNISHFNLLIKLLEKSPNTLSVLPIKSLINEWISHEKWRIEDERKRQFVNPNV